MDREGEFTMGSKEFMDALPLHQVKLKGFWMDTHEVTNAQFAEFIKATGYITVAERKLDPKDFPGNTIRQTCSRFSSIYSRLRRWLL